MSDIVIRVSPRFTGKLVVTVEDGQLKHSDDIEVSNRTISLSSLLEIAAMTGLTVVMPERK